MLWPGRRRLWDGYLTGDERGILVSGDDVSFGVLGPLEVAVGAVPAEIPAGKQRILLATLLLDVNRAVSVEDLVDRLWAEDVPDRPRSAVHVCISRLRQTLDRHRLGLARVIRTTAAGYMIELPPEGLDLTRFQRLTDDARSAAEQHDETAESAALAGALSLWRGRALSDVPSDSLHRDVVPKLTEDWIRTLERYYEVGLALGRHEDLVGGLRAHTRRHPFHERLWHHLMVALYRCGRRVEALVAYTEVRDRLREELGMSPGPELSHLHLAMLRGEVDSSPGTGPAAD
ncbi:MAG: hypothetical protein QOC93_7 [Actinomycetota bacterium]|jgi:DNA-binding SARP family transcriptional activator|nr:family transcription regulator [Cryptosporangiaceae bacterium]MDQ1674863.1 hypothetical protein [Actinomycetota bacterium]